MRTMVEMATSGLTGSLDTCVAGKSLLWGSTFKSLISKYSVSFSQNHEGASQTRVADHFKSSLTDTSHS